MESDFLKDVKNLGQIYQTGYQYIKDRYDGKIKSLKTPWTCLDEATLDGLEWGSVMVIGARPGSGKTAIANMISRNAHDLNPDQDFMCLDFQFEMTDQSTALRDFTSKFNKSYKELANVDNQMNEYELMKINEYVKKKQNSKIFQVSTPMTVDRIRATILQFLAKYKKPTVITIDHSMLVQAAPGSHTDFGKLFELGLMISELKRSSPLPVIFIVLTQMNRSIEDRNSSSSANGDLSNYPQTSDVYGGDALLMTTDILLAVNYPAKLNLTQYGPKKYIVHPDLIVFHFLKARNGENSMFFFHQRFRYFDLAPVGEPPTAQAAPLTSRRY